MCLYNSDFFGLMASIPLESKKELGISIYRFIFRFSIEKLIEFIKDPCIIFIILKYLHES